jgi:hypothetical protein
MMRIETKYNAPSLLQVFSMSVTMLLIVNGFIFLLFGVVLNISFTEIFNKNWMVLIASPLLMGMIYPLINRDGVLTAKDCDNVHHIVKNIEAFLNEKGHIKIHEDELSSSFEYDSTWKKILNFHTGSVVIAVKQSGLIVTGKRNILIDIESKLKWTPGFAF